MIPSYKPSGKFGVLALPLLFLGIVLVVPLAFAYQYAILWVPFIYINILLTVGVGVVIGIVSALIITRGRVRSLALGGLIAVLLTTSCISAKFVFQYFETKRALAAEIQASSEYTDEEKEMIIKQVIPEITFLEHIEMRVQQGWQLGRGGAPLTGLLVYGIWLIEAGIVVVVSFKRARNAATVPYNETVDAWADEVDVVMTLPITSHEMVAQIEAADSVDDLLTIPIPKTDESDTFAVYTVNSVAGNEMEDAYLSVAKIVLSVNAKGEQETLSTSIVSNAVLSTAQRERLVENASLMQEAFADYREALEEEALDEAAAVADEDALDEDASGEERSG